MVLTGWIMTGLLLVFIVGASVVPKLIGATSAVEALVGIGWSPQHLIALGITELVLIVLFVIPRTGLLGAVLMTGLLGGAMASHIRAESPLFSHTLFSIYLGVFMWGALFLRDPNLRAYLKA